MAEHIGGRGALNLTREFVKKLTGSRDRHYDLFAPRAWDVAQVYDDFTGPVINPNIWTVANGGGAGVASPAIDVGIENGAIVLVTGTANGATASSTLEGGRHFYGQNNAIIVARLTILTANSSVSVEVGFRDAITDGKIVNSKSGNTFTSTDGVCWIYDTADTDRGWDGMGVANTTAATRMTSYNVVPTAGTYEYLEVALEDTNAYFSHYTAAGKRDFGPTLMASAVTTDVLLSPHINVRARSATSKSVRVDAVWLYQGRTTA